MVKLKGFTLIEVVISIAIMGILSIAITRFFIFSVQSGERIEQQGDAAAQADAAVRVMSSIIREATDGDNGNYIISGAGTYSLGLYSDVDADDSRELVLFELDGTILKMITIEPSGDPVQYLSTNSTEIVLADSVVNNTITNEPLFQYYNSDYPGDLVNNPLSAPIDVTDISLIKTQLDVNINPAAGPDTTRVELSTKLRNKN